MRTLLGVPSRFRTVARTAIVLAATAITVRLIGASGDNRVHWLVVARDSNYTIAIDTTRIVAEYGRTYDVWYRTDHAATRFYKEKAFTRETIHAVLRCDGYRFRIMSVAMSMGSGRAVTWQSAEPQDLASQSWRRVEPGSTESDAARATCQVADWVARAQR
jgi:Surface-adhesin protein E